MDIKNNSSKTSTTGIEAVRLVGGNFRKPTPKSKPSSKANLLNSTCLAVEEKAQEKLLVNYRKSDISK